MQGLKLYLDNCEEDIFNDFVELLGNIPDMRIKVIGNTSQVPDILGERSWLSDIHEIIIFASSIGAISALWTLFRFWAKNRPRVKIIIKVSECETIEVSNITLHKLKKLLQKASMYEDKNDIDSKNQ